MLKLLIVKTSSLGDVIHNLPILADIHKHYADVEIDWLVESSFSDIPKMHPAINEVIPVAIRKWRKGLFKVNTWREIAQLKRKLATKKYDVVLDTQGLLKSALLTTLTRGIKQGYDKNSIREPIASAFYDIKHRVSRDQHAVARNRMLAAAAFSYSLPSQLPDYGISADDSQRPLLSQPYIIGLHGTSRDSKLWETNNWIKLGQALAERGLNLALPWSSEAELKRARFIAGKLSNATVLPKLSIAELASVIAHSQAAIGVDTGLSHLAAALNIPTVAIYTDTNPTLTGVCPGAFVSAINIGGVGQSPSVANVLSALEQADSHQH